MLRVILFTSPSLVASFIYYNGWFFILHSKVPQDGRSHRPFTRFMFYQMNGRCLFISNRVIERIRVSVTAHGFHVQEGKRQNICSPRILYRPERPIFLPTNRSVLCHQYGLFIRKWKVLSDHSQVNERPYLSCSREGVIFQMEGNHFLSIWDVYFLTFPVMYSTRRPFTSRLIVRYRILPVATIGVMRAKLPNVIPTVMRTLRHVVGNRNAFVRVHCNHLGSSSSSIFHPPKGLFFSTQDRVKVMISKLSFRPVTLFREIKNVKSRHFDQATIC